MSSLSERWVLSIESECLKEIILLGEASLRRAWSNFTDHDQVERPHQGLGNELIQTVEPQPTHGEVLVSKRLGGLLRHYHRRAA